MSTCSTALAIAGFAALSRAKTLAGIASVSAFSSATTVAVRRASGCSTASSPKTSPGLCTANMATSPSGVVMRAAKRPLRDAVHAVTHVTLVEDDLAAAELAPAPGLTELLLGNSCEDVDRHASTLPRL